MAKKTKKPLPRIGKHEQLKCSLIVPDPKNPRDIDLNLSRYGKIKKSIEKSGVLVPVQVIPTKGEKYRLVDGHVRCAVSKELNKETIPALIYSEKVPEFQMRVEQIILNESSVKLTPFERAKHYELLVKACGGNQAKAAKSIEVNRKTFGKRLSILKLGEKMMEQIEDFNDLTSSNKKSPISYRHMVEIAGAKSSEHRKALVDSAMKGVSSNALAKKRADLKNPSAPASKESVATQVAAPVKWVKVALGDQDDMPLQVIQWPMSQQIVSDCSAVAKELKKWVDRKKPFGDTAENITLNWTGQKTKNGPVRIVYQGGQFSVRLKEPKPVVFAKAVLIAACLSWEFLSDCVE